MLRTSDVAALFEVSERTVSEWAKSGRIPSVRTPGGHRRYPAEGIRALLAANRRSPSGSRDTGGGQTGGGGGLTAIQGEPEHLAPTGSC